jgi:hypothetical protein
LSGSAYVIGDVDQDYLINEVAGNWTFCTYGGAFSVLYAITVVEYTGAGLTARIEVIRCYYSMYVTDTIAYISVKRNI